MAKTTENVPMVKEEAGALVPLDFSADTGCGFEEADSSSYAIPFLRMLQAISDQCKKNQPEYIKGAEEGDFYNTVTEKLYKGDDGVTVIPCHYQHKYNLWAPNRGGFRGSITASEYGTMNKQCITVTVNNNSQEVEADMEGNVIVDTREHYVIVVNADGTFEPALLSLCGTQLKKSKKWMTLMQGIRINGATAPMFSQLYKLSPMPESNDKGSWSGVKIGHFGQVTSKELYEVAKGFREMVRSGTAKAVETEDSEKPF
jgi:hypothetical protein